MEQSWHIACDDGEEKGGGTADLDHPSEPCHRIAHSRIHVCHYKKHCFYPVKWTLSNTMSDEEDNSSPDRPGVRAMSRSPAPVQGIRPPQELSLGPIIVQEWKLFWQKWTNYAVIINLSTQDRAY